MQVLGVRICGLRVRGWGVGNVGLSWGGGEGGH